MPPADDGGGGGGGAMVRAKGWMPEIALQSERDRIFQVCARIHPKWFAWYYGEHGVARRGVAASDTNWKEYQRFRISKTLARILNSES